jgi:hypothetical protein
MGANNKTCLKCGETKDAECFYFNRKRNGLDNACKKCKKLHSKQWAKENRDKRKIICKKNRIKHMKRYSIKAAERYAANAATLKPRRKELWRSYYEAHRTELGEKNKAYRAENAEEIANHKRHYNQENMYKIALRAKLYRVRHKERLRESKRINHAKRMLKDTQYRLSVRLRQRFNVAVKRGYRGGSAVRDLGCSIQYLYIWLEDQFYRHQITGEYMAWENYGSKWHIDHIIPLCRFDLSSKEQCRIACNYGNLQPLWAEENLSKGTK